MILLYKSIRMYPLALALVLGLGFTLPARAQGPGLSNDGFQRRNGQMQVVRNGQPRPMTRDAHLPTGATVTKDGFVVAPNGQRTELREGQGCDLRGRSVAVLTATDGTLALDQPAPARAAEAPRPQAARSVLEEVFGSDEDDEGGLFNFRKGKKHRGKGKGLGRWK